MSLYARTSLSEVRDLPPELQTPKKKYGAPVDRIEKMLNPRLRGKARSKEYTRLYDRGMDMILRHILLKSEEDKKRKAGPGRLGEDAPELRKTAPTFANSSR